MQEEVLRSFSKSSEQSKAKLQVIKVISNFIWYSIKKFISTKPLKWKQINIYFKNLGKTSLEQKTSLVILFLYFPLLQSCVTDLGNVAVRLKEVVDFGVSQLRSSAIKPRIKPLTDAFLSTSHNISEVSFPKFLIVRW